MKKGIIQLYTGTGKGKTTAALGLAARAAGQGIKVCIVQFLKHGRFVYGEKKTFSKIKDIKVITLAQGSPVFDKKLSVKQLKPLVKKDFEKAVGIINSGKYGVVVLDEFTYAFEMLDRKKALAALLEKPENVEVVITGRNAGAALVKAAGLVTEMKEVKHPYRNGLKARKGIEY